MEAINLAMMTELPMIIINVQRGGPSTGLPTKTELADLLGLLYGRNGESPMPILAASRPSDCFDMAIEAARIALKYMTPVFVMTDAFLANGSEPWRIPDIDSLPEITHNIIARDETIEDFQVYDRNPRDPGPSLADSRNRRLRTSHRRNRKRSTYR